MKKFLVAILFIATSLLYGQSKLEGTWRTNMDQSKLSQKPYVFSLAGGMYECSTCVPKINIKADGSDQPVTGQTYDTLSARIDTPGTVTFTGKKEGKTVFEQTRAVSADGNTLTLKTTSYSKMTDKSVQTEVTFARFAQGPSGADPSSGSWKINRLKESDEGLTTTYKWSGDALSMTRPTGESYTAKPDGKDYPYSGSYSFDAVSLRRVDDHTIEATAKREGQVISIDTISIAPDGKTLTEVVSNKLTDRTSTFVSEKQDYEAAK